MAKYQRSWQAIAIKAIEFTRLAFQ